MEQNSKNLLMLKSSSIPLVLQNPLSVYVTALPYIDVEENEEIKRKVNKMIQDEMKMMQKKDYLENLKFPELKILNSSQYNTEQKPLDSIINDNSQFIEGPIYEKKK